MTYDDFLDLERWMVDHNEAIDGSMIEATMSEPITNCAQLIENELSRPGYGSQTKTAAQSDADDLFDVSSRMT